MKSRNIRIIIFVNINKLIIATNIETSTRVQRFKFNVTTKKIRRRRRVKQKGRKRPTELKSTSKTLWAQMCIDSMDANDSRQTVDFIIKKKHENARKTAEPNVNAHQKKNYQYIDTWAKVCKRDAVSKSKSDKVSSMLLLV